jgi:hypothetical protein
LADLVSGPEGLAGPVARVQPGAGALGLFLGHAREPRFVAAGALHDPAQRLVEGPEFGQRRLQQQPFGGVVGRLRASDTP